MIDKRLQRTHLGYFEVLDKPTQNELKDYYANKYYQEGLGSYSRTYDEDELKYLRLKIEQRSFIINNFVKKTKGKLLDLGCGEGFALKYYAEKGWEVKGADFSAAGLELQNPDMLKYVDIGDIYESLERYLKDKEQFDIIWLSNVLEHVLDPVKLLYDLRKLTTPGGGIVITVPNDGSALQEYCFREKIISERYWIAIPDHMNYFSYESLIRTATHTGWKCQDVIADFQIELFLLHPGSNYINDKSQGTAAHRARIQMELLMADRKIEDVVTYYRSIAKVGLGRVLTAFFKPD